MSTKQKVVTSNGTIRMKKRKIDASDIQLYTLCVIPILLVLVFKYVPMFGIVIAFKNYTYGGGIWGSPWVGLKNFEFFFRSGEMVRLIRNTLGNNFLFIVFGIVASLAVAILLFELKSRNATKVFQTILITPHFMSWVVVAYMAYAILNPNGGFLNQFTESFQKFFGIIGEAEEVTTDWYSKPNAWPIILTIASVWKNVGMDSVVYYASLMGIDTSLFEAAEVDGANKWQRTIHIVLPSLVPLIVILTILKIGGIFHSDFGLFYNVTMESAGGILKETTDVIDTYIYNALLDPSAANTYGQTAAVGLMQSIVGMVLVITTNALSKKVDKDLGLF